MSASASSAPAKKKAPKKSAVKKKHQDQWDELVKFIRTLAREAGLPLGTESNFVLHLFEAYAADNAPFPPAQMIVSAAKAPASLAAASPDNVAAWMRILSAALVSRACATYTNIFLTKQYVGLKGLAFWGIDLGDEGCRSICEALPMLPYCCKLDLIDCNLGVGACEALGVSLKHRRTTHLKILRLDHNTNIGAQGLARLSEGLYFNSLLHTLSANYCGMKADAGPFLKNILCTKGIGLKTLSLEGNALERDGIIHLASGLSNNTTLTSLNLVNNAFGGNGDALPGESDALVYLAVGLAGCRTLKTVDINGNLIGDVGVDILYKAACANQLTHITSLEFTPFVETDKYRALVEKIEANKPPPKKKTKKKLTKKK